MSTQRKTGKKGKVGDLWTFEDQVAIYMFSNRIRYIWTCDDSYCVSSTFQMSNHAAVIYTAAFSSNTEMQG